MQSKQSGQKQAISADAAKAFNLANAAFRNADFTAALRGAEHALELAPALTLAKLMRGRCLTRLDRPQEALVVYDAILQLNPDDFNAALERGNVVRNLGQAEAAIESYLRAHRSRPVDHRPHLALAKLFAEHQSVSNAEREAYNYHRALVLSASNPKTITRVHFEMGVSRLKADNPSGALDAFRQAWMSLSIFKEEDPALKAEVLIETAKVHIRLGLEQDARKALETAARSEDEASLKEVANLCYNCNFWEDGIAVLYRAVDLHPQSLNAHLALADMLSRCWKLKEARTVLDHASSLGPLSDTALHQLSAKIASSMGDVDAAAEHYRALVDLGSEAAASGLAMNALYRDGLSGREIANLHRKLFEPLSPKTALLTGSETADDLDRPLRIGMVTGDLHRQHPVDLFMQPLLARWPKDDMPLTVYFTGTSIDTQTKLAKTRVSTWRDIGYDRLARQVQEDSIDVLIDLAGHTSNRAMQQFAKRMAPVQVSYLGYPGSTWVPGMDWIIADATVAPKEHAHLFSERIARLPNSVFCFAPDVDYPLPEMGHEHLQRPLTFGSFNNVPKLTTETIRLWAEVLKAVDGSRLLLKAPSFQDQSVINRYRMMFEAHGVSPDRIEFRGPSALPEMMAEYGEIDIGLDPVNFNGGTTTLQAMWMGVPVLSLEGDKFASRMGSSFLRAAGMTDWIAKDEVSFVQRAVQHTSDREKLRTIKQELRANLQQRPAWNADLFAKDFIACLSHIWRDACVPK